MRMTFVCVVYKLCMPSARGGQQRVLGPLELDHPCDGCALPCGASLQERKCP